MIKYVRTRLPRLLVVLLGVSVLSFLLATLSPVDPAEAFARRSMLNPAPEQIEEIRTSMGLHLPVYRQYLNWLGDCLRGDLGVSLMTRNPVGEDIAVKLPETLKLTGLAMLWIVMITVPVSILCAIYRGGWFDHAVRILTMTGISLPNFWLGFVLLLLFAVAVPIFKVADYGNFRSLILPSLSLALPAAASMIRMFRATLLSNMNQDYVEYAKARGVPDSRIMRRHVLGNSLPPFITLFVQYLGYMIAGSAVVENLFSWNGIGTHLVNAIIARDLPSINGCVLVIALFIVVFNMIADAINVWLNPQLANEGGGMAA
jgi:ABC-type dipeptide/oligopeptide/nickel transport system permease component